MCPSTSARNSPALRRSASWPLARFLSMLAPHSCLSAAGYDAAFCQGPCWETDWGLIWVKISNDFYFLKTSLNAYLGSQHTSLQTQYQGRGRGSGVQQWGWSTRERNGSHPRKRGAKNFLTWLCHPMQKLKRKNLSCVNGLTESN